MSYYGLNQSFPLWGIVVKRQTLQIIHFKAFRARHYVYMV